MRTAAAVLAALAVAAAPPTKTVKLNGHTFTIPDGFEITLAAGADLAPRPIVCDFDAKGRLYVCDSSGSNEKTAVQLEKKPHRVLRLEDTNGDGVFDRQTVFVKNVMLPEGAMWLAGSLYVAAPPHILKFTDTDDDGVADKEEIWFDGKTLTGCANDLHGPYRGPDGYIYWCKGAFAQQEYTLPNGKKFTTRAAHIFRATPDGKNVEPVMTGGMDNPVDVVFTPSGERIFTTTFFQRPGDGKRDGLIHAVYGGIYGKDHDPVYDHPWTSPHFMPVLTHMGPAAPCGLHRYESDQFGPDHANNLFACQFNMRKVSRHVLVPKGSTYETKDSDFVVSDNLDFHPTDVIEDADGSLLIVDTGGWYKLCCPTSQLVKPDVTGGIYRVRKAGAHKTRTKPAAPPLPPLYTVALKRDRGGFDLAVNGLKDASLPTRRLAAEALGRIGDPKAVPALLDALADPANDRVLDHSLTYALIEISDRSATAAGLKHDSPRVRRAVLAALDQMPNGKLDPADVLAELNAADPALRETAWWIAGRHPEWGAQLAGRFAEQLKTADKLAPAARDELADRLVKFAKNEAVQKTLGDALDGTPDATRRFSLGVMARSGLKSLPATWSDRMGGVIGGKSADTAMLGFAVLRAVPPTPDQYTGIRTVSAFSLKFDGREWSDREWLSLFSVSPPGTETATDVDFTRAFKALTRDASADRALAVDALTKTRLTPLQLAAIAASLKTVGPLELPRVIALFTKSKAAAVFPKSEDETVGLALVAALTDPAVRPAVRTDVVKPILDKYPLAVRAEAEKLYALLAEARKGETAKLDALLAGMKTGDIRRGQAVFNGTKAACIACHKVGYVGGLVGPDLTRIGGIRTERDLLEAIVFPSASFVRSYEPVRVTTADGRTLNGILKKDAPDEIVVTVAADQETKVARADVESVSPSSVSVMPAGLDQQLTPQDLADLVAFLRACK